MRKVKVITDSCADLTPELMEKYDIDYAKMSTTEDGKDEPALLSWSEKESHAFYDRIRNGRRITTAQVPVEEFNGIFRKYLEQGCDIVYIACSSKQSGSVNTGHVTAQNILKEYEGAKIACIDSLNASMGEGVLAIEAAKLASAGKDTDEIVSYIMPIRNNVQEFITVHTLEYLKRAGRVTASSAFLGNLMGIKPILISDANGVQTPCRKVKGRQNSIAEVAKLLKENILEPEKQTVYVIHSDADREEVEFLVQRVKDEIPCRDVCVCGIGPIIGASIGPDSIGVIAFGKEITYEVES